MSYNFAPYQSATRCVGGSRPGTIYLDLFLKEMFPNETWFGNIYSCRDVVGGSGRSHHAEGRADDRMQNQARPASGKPVSVRSLELLGPHGRALGIDHVILNLTPWQAGRGNPRIYAAAYPGGKYYSGLHPHKDHNHWGLSRWAAENLTLTMIRKVVLQGQPAPAPTPPIPTPTTGFRDKDNNMWQYANIDESLVRRAWENGYIHPKTEQALKYFLDNLGELQKGDQAAVAPGFREDWLNFRRAVTNGVFRQ